MNKSEEEIARELFEKYKPIINDVFIEVMHRYLVFGTNTSEDEIRDMIKAKIKEN